MALAIRLPVFSPTPSQRVQPDATGMVGYGRYGPRKWPGWPAFSLAGLRPALGGGGRRAAAPFFVRRLAASPWRCGAGRRALLGARGSSLWARLGREVGR
jgi:hypothetical protein